HAGRREERILYMSFTHTQQFQPWLEALRSNDACVVGVFSVALVAAQPGKRLGFKGGRYLMVSGQQARLRQGYIENGRIRFARVALLATGVATFAFCLLISAVRLLDIHQVNEQAQNDRVQEARASEEYARLQTRFPKTPISSDTLKTVVKNYRTLLRQSASPG